MEAAKGPEPQPGTIPANSSSHAQEESMEQRAVRKTLRGKKEKPRSRSSKAKFEPIEFSSSSDEIDGDINHDHDGRRARKKQRSSGKKSKGMQYVRLLILSVSISHSRIPTFAGKSLQKDHKSTLDATPKTGHSEFTCFRALSTLDYTPLFRNHRNPEICSVVVHLTKAVQADRTSLKHQAIRAQQASWM